MSMFIELHMIQNFAPHCLNRDDTNAPKDCEFGGYRRARISSQCLKRAIRTSPVFSETLESEIGVRTKLIYKILEERLSDIGKPDEEIEPILRAFVPEVLGSLDKNDKTKVLFFISAPEIDSIYNALLSNWDILSNNVDKEKKLAEECKNVARNCVLGKLSPDIALFGRMMAERSANNVDAASQVAHAISTNRVNMEMDFYTAIDDLQIREEPGAGMMGTVEYNSSCFYRYSLVDFNQLLKNLDGDKDLSKKALEAFVKASVAAIPSGKQTSMAAHNPPSLILLIIRENGQPISLANAFIKPVNVFGNEEKDIVAESASLLDKYFAQLIGVYGAKGLSFIGLCSVGDQSCHGLESSGAKKYASLEELVSAMRGAIDDSIAHAT